MSDDLYEFEKRVWRRDLYDWCWEVRHAGLMSTPFASGTADTRRAANGAVNRAVFRERTKLDTPWTRVP